MIGKLAALILLCRVYLIQSADAARPLSVTVVENGGNVTLQCSTADESQFFLWFKQSLGHLRQEVASGHTLKISEPFKEPHFTATKDNNETFLTITNVSKEDEAVYICVTGFGYSQKSSRGIFLAVNDDNQTCVDLKQSPEAVSVTPGDSVNLQCSLSSKNKKKQCPGGHNVYWIRSGSGESHPGVIYTLRNSDEQVERSCVYSLSKPIQNSSDAGTYYCAVVTCGKILFGGGTKVDTRAELDPVVLVLGGLLACCVIVIAVLILHIHRGKVCKGAMSASQHLGHEDDQSNDQDDKAKAATYTVLDFSARTVKRPKNRRTEPPQDCVYSAVRADYQDQQHP